MMINQTRGYFKKLRYIFFCHTSIRKKVHTNKAWSWIFEVWTPGRYFVDSLQMGPTNLK